MKIDKNDPRLTAYVLNEASKADRILIEQALQSDASLKAEIELLKSAVSRLHDARNESAYRLNPNQREKVLNRKPSGWNWWPAVGGFATAGLALMLVFKNPVSTDSSALLGQEKTAKLEAVSETKTETVATGALAPEPRKEKLDSIVDAAPPTVPVQASEQASLPDPKGEDEVRPSLAQHEAEAPIEKAKAFGGAPAASQAMLKPEPSEETAEKAAPATNFKDVSDSKDSMANLSLGSGSGAKMARAAAPKKTATPSTLWVLVSAGKPGGPIALNAEIEKTVLPLIQTCAQSVQSGLVLVVHLSLKESKVTQVRIEEIGRTALNSETLECLKAGQPQNLQNNTGIRDYSYQLKAVSK